MSVQALSWVFDHSESRLAARHVLIAIANHTDKYGNNSWPSVATIAKESKLSEREVQRCFLELEAMGELKILKGKGFRGHHLFSLPMMAGGDKLSPLETSEGVTSGPEGVTSGPRNKEEPSLEATLITCPPSSDATLNTKSKAKPRTKKIDSDPRYPEFVEALSTGYKRRGWQFIFNGADGKQLKSLLQYAPKMKVEEFRMCLKHYFDSEGSIPGAMPHTYLMKLPNFWAGPLNQFGKLMEHRTAKHEVLEV